jgi:hypothetical protein
MALRFCSVKLARLCPAEPFPGKKLQAKPGSGPGIICQVQPQPNIKSTGGQIMQALIPQRVQVHSWAYSAPPWGLSRGRVMPLALLNFCKGYRIVSTVAQLIEMASSKGEFLWLF